MSERLTMRPPRVLVATPIVESKTYIFEEWCASLVGQRTDLLWDLAIVDNTDHPRPGYVDWLREWAHSKPFGERHRVRLLRFGEDVNGLTFRHPMYKIQYAERLLWRKFAAWTSYDHLLSLECDVLMPPDGLQTLYDARLAWAAAWMTTRRMKHPSDPNTVEVFPLLFHGLTPERYHAAKDWEDVVDAGYLEPPGVEPFPCAVTHLGCTLLHGDLVRRVPYMLTGVGGDVNYSWDSAAAGFQPMCVPAVQCDHVDSKERPDGQPRFRSKMAGHAAASLPGGS
jgi:hypothetical protein